MIESTRLCPRCLQTLRLVQSVGVGGGLCYLCSACGWGTDDESDREPRGSVSPFDLPYYVRSAREQEDGRPRAAGE